MFQPYTIAPSPAYMYPAMSAPKPTPSPWWSPATISTMVAFDPTVVVRDVLCVTGNGDSYVIGVGSK